MDERAEPGSRPRSGGGWAVPGAGEEHPGLSWEGEGEVTRERPPAGSRSLVWRAVAVVAVGALLGALGLALARGVSGEEGETALPGREDTDVRQVEVGECLASLPGAGGDELDVLPCERQHIGEVVGLVELPDDTGPAGYPGDDEVVQSATAGCSDEFASYVGSDPATSALGLVVVPPGEVAWRAGTNRTAVCIAEGPDRVGSVRGSGS